MEHASEQLARTEPPAAVAGLVSPEARLLGFERIKQARSRIGNMKPLAAATRRNYQKKAALMGKALEAVEGSEVQQWELVLAKYAPKSNSFFAMRAAATWAHKQVLVRLLAQQDTLQKVGTLTSQWVELVNQIEDLLATLDIIESMDRSDLLELSGQESQRSRSLRSDLPRLAPRWRESMVQHAVQHSQYADAVCVLAATGCRAIELSWGVGLRLEYDREVAHIKGAKTTGSSGQPWRELAVSRSALTPELFAKLQVDGELRVGIWSTAGLRKHLRNSSRALWPKGKPISPYHFRHELATDLRESGWTREEIGAALGHRVSETSAGYGLRRRPRQRSPGAVQAPTIMRNGTVTALSVRPPATTFTPPPSAPRARSP